jgi:hypothetical protein
MRPVTARRWEWFTAALGSGDADGDRSATSGACPKRKETPALWPAQMPRILTACDAEAPSWHMLVCVSA